MKYQPPYGVSDANAGYVNGNPAEGIPGSIPPATSIEYPQREIVNIITKGGVVPADTDLFQLTKGARRALYAWGIDTGSQNSMSVQLDPPLDSYASGLEVRVLVANDNTGATTIRINGLPTQQIVKKDGSSLWAGDLKQGGIAVLVHDGGRFQLVSGAAGSTTITGGWYNGADWIVDTGPVNHMQGTPPIVPASLYAGISFSVLVNNDNTGATDLNVASLGAVAVQLPNGEPLDLGDIVKGMTLRVIYDGTKFTMTSKIFMEIIDTALTKIVGPNAGADFPNLIVALQWASRRRFADNGTLTFAMQGRTTGSPIVHTYTKSIRFYHPQGEHISIVGPGMNFIPSPGNFGSAVPPNSPGSIIGEAAGHLAMLRSAFQTEIHFTNPGGGFSVVSCTCGLLKNILITGSAVQTGGGGGGVFVGTNAHLSIDTVASCYANTPWYVAYASVLSGQNMYTVGGGAYNGITQQASILIGGNPGSNNGNFIIADMLLDGIQYTFGGQVTIGCDSKPRIYSCQRYGIFCGHNVGLHAVGMTFINCSDTACIISYSGTAYIVLGSILASGWGYWCTAGSYLDCGSCSTTAVGNADYMCQAGSTMNASGFGNGAAQFSPAPNTNGNGNAYIMA